MMPWSNSAKEIEVDQPTHPHKPPKGMEPPIMAIPETLPYVTFTPLMLYGSIALCNTLSTRASKLYDAMTSSTQLFIREMVHNTPGRFTIEPDAFLLGDSKLISLSHDIGAGLAHLYLMNQGFIWRINMKERITKRDGIPDSIYDNGGPENELVVIETKGAIGGNMPANALNKWASIGYAEQVEKWLDENFDGKRIVHGYAFGSWAPAGSDDSAIFIHETAWTTRTQTQIQEHTPSYQIACAHYSALFRLCGIHAVSDFINGSLDEKRMDTLSLRFIEIQFGNQTFLVYENALKEFEICLAYCQKLPFVFGIELHSAFSFLNHFLPGTDRRIKVASEAERIQLNQSEEIAWFPDGLAVLPISKTRHETSRSWLWSPREGLRPKG